MKKIDFKPPLAPVKKFSSERHGSIYEDNYAWLKDENWQRVVSEPSLLKKEIANYLNGFIILVQMRLT